MCTGNSAEYWEFTGILVSSEALSMFCSAEFLLFDPCFPAVLFNLHSCQHIMLLHKRVSPRAFPQNPFQRMLRNTYAPRRCRANKEHIRQSGPESGPGCGHFQVKSFELFPFRLAADGWVHAWFRRGAPYTVNPAAGRALNPSPTTLPQVKAWNDGRKYEGEWRGGKSETRNPKPETPHET